VYETAELEADTIVMAANWPWNVGSVSAKM
jgi:hypothetical protein